MVPQEEIINTIQDINNKLLHKTAEGMIKSEIDQKALM
jgi:hypothetical protein